MGVQTPLQEIPEGWREAKRCAKMVPSGLRVRREFPQTPRCALMQMLAPQPSALTWLFNKNLGRHFSVGCLCAWSWGMCICLCEPFKNNSVYHSLVSLVDAGHIRCFGDSFLKWRKRSGCHKGGSNPSLLREKLRVLISSWLCVATPLIVFTVR